MDKLISIIVLILGAWIFIKILPGILAVVAILFLLAVIVAVINGISRQHSESTEEYPSNDDIIDVEYTEEEIKEEDPQ